MKGYLPYLYNHLEIIKTSKVKLPRTLLDEVDDHVFDPRFARKLDFDETNSSEKRVEGNEYVRVLKNLDEEVLATMHKLQRLTMREKRFHIILTVTQADAKMTRGNERWSEFGGVGMQSLTGLRDLVDRHK